MPVGYEQLVSTSFQHSKLPSYQHWQLSLNLVHGCWFSCRPGVWWPGVCTRKALKTYVYIYTGMYDYDHGRHTWRLWAGRQLKWGIRTYSSGNNTLTTSHRYDTEVCLPFLSTTKGTTTTTTLRHILTYLDTIYIYIYTYYKSVNSYRHINHAQVVFFVPTVASCPKAKGDWKLQRHIYNRRLAVFLTACKPPNAPMANGDVRSEDMLKYLAKDWVLDLEVPCVQL